MTEVALHVEPNEKAPGIARSHLASIRDTLEPRYDDIAIVVSELVTNSVRHSSTRGIDVTVKANDSMIRVEVTDDGPGFGRDDARGDHAPSGASIPVYFRGATEVWASVIPGGRGVSKEGDAIARKSRPPTEVHIVASRPIIRRKRVNGRSRVRLRNIIGRVQDRETARQRHHRSRNERNPIVMHRSRYQS
jgi:hypothetical protein